VVGAVTWPKW